MRATSRRLEQSTATIQPSSPWRSQRCLLRGDRSGLAAATTHWLYTHVHASRTRATRIIHGACAGSEVLRTGTTWSLYPPWHNHFVHHGRQLPTQSNAAVARGRLVVPTSPAAVRLTCSPAQNEVRERLGMLWRMQHPQGTAQPRLIMADDAVRAVQVRSVALGTLVHVSP